MKWSGLLQLLKNVNLQTFIVLLFVSPSYTGYSWTKHGKPWMQEDKNNLSPTFEVTTLSPKITVPVGQSVILPCIVRNLGDKVVSWIRTKDLHIITSGVLTYTSDNRFEVLHGRVGDSWALRIRNTRHSDSGKYECQVNTDPKMNYALLLTVTDAQQHDSPASDTSELVGPAASIRGPKEVYVRPGSTITLTCVVHRHPPPFGGTAGARSQLKWTHRGRDVSFQSSRGGISVDTDYRSADVTSRLQIAHVSLEDAGNYTCEDYNVKPDTVTVHVVEGEYSEAMQRDTSRGATLDIFSVLSWSILLINLIPVYGIT